MPDAAELTLRRSRPLDLEPLVDLLTDEADLALVNPSAKHPFDPMEWYEIWLNEPGDAAYYLVDDDGREQGFFALRPGIGPEQRHLAYVYVAPEARGGAGDRLTTLVEKAARDLDALTVTLKCETDNAPALNAYRAAGYEELDVNGGMATMRIDLGA
ncbi:GNAT family N-acetyltransferase [Wenxinia saemankumensis]|uniref:Protein N-acetyltransferase, RimJ/RimL family n=1 Tax=Wenxinia saemankumensis TaxID=1447782 RepID=A0A1M6CDB5_9RHOB|nr:GNAT family N-acetyltransferase [Wenxinia saemankumensis]SHI58801.1 Protein N-acetyltransferase, RimJ/RimL family [Wenxinia saemankumensis]